MITPTRAQLCREWLNTGNAQSQTNVVQSGSEAGDIEVDGGGSSIEVSPEQVTQTQQEVEQAAAAAAE